MAQVYLHSGKTRAKNLAAAPLPPRAKGLSKFDAMFINPKFFAEHGLAMPDPAWLGAPLDKYPAIEF